MKCKKCDMEINESAAFCKNCGSSLLPKKNCGICGKENEPDAIYCEKCGEKLEPSEILKIDKGNSSAKSKEMTDNSKIAAEPDINEAISQFETMQKTSAKTNEEKTMNSSSFHKYIKQIMIGSISCIVLIALFIGLFMHNNDFRKYKKAMEQGEYEVAAQIYGNAPNKDLEKMNSEVLKQLGTIKSDFIEEHIDIEAINTRFGLLRNIVDLLEINQAEEEVNALHLSRTAFQKGQKELSEKTIKVQSMILLKYPPKIKIMRRHRAS